ncbi:MAG: nitroreductase family protein [Bacillota bacterium]
MNKSLRPKVDFFEVVDSRRSVFNFDPEKSLDDNLLKAVINNAVLAPSSYNLQPWKLLVIKSQKKRQEVYDKACQQQKVLDAPVLLIILGDKIGYKRHNPMWEYKKEAGRVDDEKINKIIGHNDKITYSNSDKKLAFAIRNSSLLAMSIMFSAKAFGIDTHPMIGFSPEKIRKMFDLEDNIAINMLISVGYRDKSKNLKPREYRLKYDEIVEEY